MATTMTTTTTWLLVAAVAGVMITWWAVRREPFTPPPVPEPNWGLRAASILHHLDHHARSCSTLRRLVTLAENQALATRSCDAVNYDDVILGAGLAALPETTKRDLRKTLASVVGQACAAGRTRALYADCGRVMQYAS